MKNTQSPSSKKRSGFLSAFLIYYFSINSISALCYIFWEKGDDAIRHKHPLFPGWTFSYLAIACLVNVIATVAMWKWKRWGVYLATLNKIVVIVFYFFYSAFWSIGWSYLDLLILFILVLPVWKQMD